MEINDKYRHIKSGEEYIITDFCKTKINNEWIDCIMYKSLSIPNNPMFVRTTKEFDEVFEKIIENKYQLKKAKIWTMPHERVILFPIKENDYLVIDTRFDYNEDECYMCDIGDYVTLDKCDVEDIDYDIKKTQLYNTFLFQSFLKSINIIDEIDYERVKN